jgi:hypothetical protein
MSESSRRLPAYCDAFPRTRALSTPFSRFSAYSCTCALTRFRALMHFVSDRIQPHIRVFSMPSCITRWIPARARLARLSRAYQLVPALAHLRVFHALMHFAPDRTQTAYHDSHIRLFLAPPCTMRHVPMHARLARLSRAHQHVPALAHLRVFMHSCVFAHSRTFALDRTQLHYCQNAHASYPCRQLRSRFSPDAL